MKTRPQVLPGNPGGRVYAVYRAQREAIANTGRLAWLDFADHRAQYRCLPVGGKDELLAQAKTPAHAVLYLRPQTRAERLGTSGEQLSHSRTCLHKRPGRVRRGQAESAAIRLPTFIVAQVHITAVTSRLC